MLTGNAAPIVTWITADDVRWKAVEAAMEQQRLPCALDGRVSWVHSQPAKTTRLLAVSDCNKRWVGTATLDVAKSRVLPGHTLLRARRFGHGLPPQAWQPAIAALKHVALSERTLRLNVEVFSPAHREEVGLLLQAEGFQRVPPSSYRHTLTMDLLPSEAELLSARSSLRKRLREMEKTAAVVATLGPEFADRLVNLQQQAMQRSGGSFRVPDWPRVLGYSQDFPEHSRVVGLFLDPDQTQPDDLIGFAWGCMHGDHAEYRAAGTTQTAVRISVSYPLLWDLVRWARSGGATWFDLGGVTVASQADDPLAGISEFKRSFSKTVEEVGEEWMLEPSPGRAVVAARLGRLSEFARGARSKLHSMSRT